MSKCEYRTPKSGAVHAHLAANLMSLNAGLFTQHNPVCADRRIQLEIKLAELIWIMLPNPISQVFTDFIQCTLV